MVAIMNGIVEKKQTDHTGQVYTKNDWGVDLQQLTVRHRQSNDSSKQQEITYYDVPAGATAEPPLIITYTTGTGSSFDYWWVKFVTSTGETYVCKKDFYCSISSDDDGVVHITLDGSTKKMYVTFSESSGCKVTLELETPDKEQELQSGESQ